MNQVNLIGRLTQDPELRTAKNGNPFVAFTIAINEWGQQNNTNFINCFAWNKTAENMDRFLKKGSLVAVEGSLRSRTTTDDATQRRMTQLSVSVFRVEFLEKSGGNRPNQQQSSPQIQSQPINNNQSAKDNNNNVTFEEDDTIIWD